jgi:hypothetical protein
MLEAEMLGKLLVPESIARTNGASPAVELNADLGKLIILTLAIDRVLEQEALQISVWGSADQQDWGLRPLTSFPPKCYCGIYSQLLNMTKHPGVRYLRVEWKVSRWSKPAGDPLFEFCVFAEDSGARLRRPAEAVAAGNTAAVA